MEGEEKTAANTMSEDEQLMRAYLQMLMSFLRDKSLHCDKKFELETSIERLEDVKDAFGPFDIPRQIDLAIENIRTAIGYIDEAIKVDEKWIMAYQDVLARHDTSLGAPLEAATRITKSEWGMR